MKSLKAVSVVCSLLTLHLTPALADGPPPDGIWADPSGRYFKYDDRPIALDQPSTRTASTWLLRGSLQIANDRALGEDFNKLTMIAGTQLGLSPGLTLNPSIEVLRDDPVAILPPGMPLAPRTGPDSASFVVQGGEATLAGLITAHAPVFKDGAGTLRVTAFNNQSVLGDAFTVRAGGLRMDGLWLGGPIVTQPGTVLSGTGFIQQAQVAGHLQPGSPDEVGTLMFDQHLQLAPSAQTRIRIDADGQSDSLFAWGTMQLQGTLQVEATPGDWTPQTRWTIAEAEGGLDERFATLLSNQRYLDPVLTHTPTTLILGLAYNRHGLNIVDGAWRSALVEDSRFLREAALAHATHDGAWLQTWGFNTERPSGQDQLADDRDTTGLQLGITRPIGRTKVSAFAGTQHTDLSSRHDPAARFGARDTSAYLGLGWSLATAHNLRLTAGAAHAWHSARLQRSVDTGEPALSSRSHAQLTQAWLEARSDQPLPVGDWGWTPYVRLAWLQLNRPAVTEADRSLAAVQLESRSEQRWASHFGVQLQRRWDTPHGDAHFTADAGLQSLWGGQTLHGPQAYRAGPSRRWDVASPDLTRHALSLNLGVDAPVARRVRVNLAYGGQYAPRQTQHGVWLGVKMSF